MLTDPRIRGLFIPMTNPVTADDLERFAAQMEETAKALRMTASALRGNVSVQQLPRSQSESPPEVLPMAELALKQAGRPMHVSDLVDAVRSRGAFVKDKFNLSSMLSKDKRKTFRPVDGRRGVWELVASKSTSTVNKPGV